MSDDAENETAATPKPSKLPLIIGFMLALLGGGGGFFFFYTSGGETATTPAEEIAEYQVDKAHFVALQPLQIPLGDGQTKQVLSFQAHLEVAGPKVDAIAALEPRILDVLNTYLRAVELEILQDRRALLMLRAQMLRRIQVVTDDQAVQDLLITEFIVN